MTKNPNKLFRKALILITSLSSLSMMNINPYDLLGPEDQEMEITDQTEGPALSSGLNAANQWESFNTWQCFSTESIQLECSELDYGAIYVPTLRMSNGTILYDFSLDPEPDLNCEEILAKWTALLKNQRSFCVYAAYLQKYHDNPFELDGIEEWHLWIVNQIKTLNGYWNSFEPDADITIDNEPDGA